MNETPARQPVWYWGIVALLLLIGVGMLSSTGNRPIAILNKAVSAGRDSDQDDSTENLVTAFQQFRSEVSQLTGAEQRAVWQSLRQRSESLAEQTFYTFFALPEEEQQTLIDHAIDRLEERRRLWTPHGFGYRGSENPPHWPVREVSSSSELDRPFAELSLEERLATRRDNWEDTTLQSHAMRSEFLRMLTERRRERGIPEPFRRGG